MTRRTIDPGGATTGPVLLRYGASRLAATAAAAQVRIAALACRRARGALRLRARREVSQHEAAMAGTAASANGWACWRTSLRPSVKRRATQEDVMTTEAIRVRLVIHAVYGVPRWAGALFPVVRSGGL